MARYTDYRQYDDKPFGYGEFELDDGSVYVLDDPERARSVLSMLGDSSFAKDVDNESTNIAERGSADRQGERLSNKQQLENAAAKLAGVSEPNAPSRAFRGIDTGPDPMRRAVAGPGGGEDELDARQKELSAELDQPEPEEEPDPDPARVEPSPEEARDAEAAQRYQSAAALVPSRKGGTDPRALGPGVAVDKNFSRRGGLAPEEYNRQAGDRASVHTAGDELIARQYQEDQSRAAIEQERLRAEALGLKKQNDAQALELQKRGQKYQEDRAWLEKDVDAWYDKKASPDGGLREKRGALGNIASAIAQFMGAYAAIVTGTPNFANQILNRKMDAAVEAQLEDFRRGRVKRDGQMQRMADRGMSLDQMRSALRVQQELALRKEVEAASLEEGTREAKQAAERLLMDRQEQFVNKENEYRTAALGEQTVTGEYVRPSAGRELSPLEKLLETNKILEARNEGARQARGGAPAERAEDMAFKREERQHQRSTEQNKLSEPQAKAESAHQAVTNLGSKAGLVRDKSGKWVVGDGAVPPGLLQKAGEAVTGGFYQGDIAPAFDAAVEAFGRQQSGGVIGKDERPAFEVQLGQKTFSRKQLADRLNAAELNIEAKRKKDLDDIRSGRTNAAPSSWNRGR
jgi:hypothetical protein